VLASQFGTALPAKSELYWLLETDVMQANAFEYAGKKDNAQVLRKFHR
jgi:hypothetical protein